MKDAKPAARSSGAARGAALDRDRRCVLCSAPAVAAASGVGGYRICRVCDVAWRAIENPTDAAGDWERHYYGDEGIRELHEKRVSGLTALARRITEISPSRGRLLDVGAGVGIFMEAMQRAGWSVEGVEPSRIAARSARERTGARVHEGLLEDLDLETSSFDALTFFDALRTVPDPLAFLRKARSLLRPGGVLIIREVHRKAERFREWAKAARRQRVSAGRSACEFRQCFSPRSLLFAFEQAGLTHAWVEPSPVYVEPDGVRSRWGTLVKQALGRASAAAYRISGRRVTLGPNLLAFGRAPDP